MWWKQSKNQKAPLKDYYLVLGVPQGASQKAITQAFRKKAQSWHPDRNNSAEAKEKFQELVEAYQILKSSDKRNDFDARIISEFCDSFVFSLDKEEDESKKNPRSEFRRILGKK